MSHNVFWSALEAAGAAMFSIVAAFIIARLIGPTELGTGATAVAVHVLLWVAVNALFADAIVQRDTINETTISSAAWASIAFGCGAAALQAGSGWLLAWMLDDVRLVPMALLLAVPFPFVGMGGALQGLLTRQRRYRALAMRTLLGQGSGMVIGIVLASAHAGAWALVVQQATGSLLAALVLMSAARWRPRAVCHWSEVVSLLRIGLPLTASTLLQIGRYRIFAILIGGTAGATALGQIHVAFRLVDTVREIAFTALWRLLLPILSERQHDDVALLRQVDQLLRFSSIGMMPLCSGLAVGLVPLTTLLLGPTWHAAGVAAEPLVALTVLLALMFPSGVALVAVGQARYSLYANLAGLLATSAFVLLLRPTTPWMAVLVWCGAQAFISPYSLWVNARALGVGLLRPLRAGIPMLVVSAIAASVAMMVDAGGLLDILVRRAAIFVLVFATCGGLLIWSMRAAYFGSGQGAGHRLETDAVRSGSKSSSIIRAKI
ncbi:MAG TPA: oligosaccharide flippase family protein [Acetobacteraceae bacterium]|nr:oligosaccharide flippase family protein [Acetobacteraceae bacterium]